VPWRDRSRTGQHAVVERKTVLIPLAAALILTSASCAGGSSASRASATTTTIGSRTSAEAIREPTEAGLRAAAIAYANAFLRGSPGDVIAILDPKCASMRVNTPGSQTAANGELRRFRVALQRHTGVDPSRIQVRNVDVRAFRGTSGDAQATYGLPVAAEGNDNWNSYAYSRGRWYISGCDLKFPIGGRSTSAVSTTTTPPSSQHNP
jgi:hypothetical protein